MGILANYETFFYEPVEIGDREVEVAQRRLVGEFRRLQPRPDRRRRRGVAAMRLRRAGPGVGPGPGRPLLWGVTYFFLCEMLRDVGHQLPLSAPA